MKLPSWQPRSLRTNPAIRHRRRYRPLLETLEDRQTPTVTPTGLDFGDAADSYSTLLASNGPRHALGSSLFLGAAGDADAIDAEADGQPSTFADGDDLTDCFDETGVRLVPYTAGQVGTVEVLASGLGELDAFMDFNRNGSFADPGEKIFNSVVVQPGLNRLTFLVPANAVSGVTFSRFRLSTQGGLSFNGPAFDGEVEDHSVDILGGLAPEATPPAPVAVGAPPSAPPPLDGGAVSPGNGLFVVPGRPGQVVRLRVRYTAREALFANEIGLFLLDANGRVNGLRPGDPGFARQAMSRSRRRILFRSGQTVGAQRTLTLQAGQVVGFYIVQNDSTVRAQRLNPGNRLNLRPLCFFTTTEANPDGKVHGRLRLVNSQAFRLAWEDLTGTGDRDFDDAVLSIRLQVLTA